MSLLFLTNTIGVASGTTIHATAAATNYDTTDYIAGPRSRLVRHAAGTSHNAGYNCTSAAVTHAVLSRADYWKNSQNPTDIKVQYSTSNTTDSTTTPGNMTMVGYRSQDWVKTISRTSDRFRLLFTSGSSQAVMYAHVYFSSSFAFNNEPQIASDYSMIEKGAGSRVKPLMGDQWYETELVFSLFYSNITKAKMQAFRALPLYHPFFLYDEDGYFWDHKLEHVIIAEPEPWTETRRGDDNYDLALTVRRLRHYN